MINQPIHIHIGNLVGKMEISGINHKKDIARIKDQITTMLLAVLRDVTIESTEDNVTMDFNREPLTAQSRCIIEPSGFEKEWNKQSVKGPLTISMEAGDRKQFKSGPMLEKESHKYYAIWDKGRWDMFAIWNGVAWTKLEDGDDAYYLFPDGAISKIRFGGYIPDPQRIFLTAEMAEKMKPIINESEQDALDYLKAFYKKRAQEAEAQYRRVHQAKIKELQLSWRKEVEIMCKGDLQLQCSKLKHNYAMFFSKYNLPVKFDVGIDTVNSRLYLVSFDLATEMIFQALGISLILSN